MAGDETAAEKFDVLLAPPDDPEEWEYDATSDVYYRSPTSDEMREYGWTSEHLLVIPNMTAFVGRVVAAQSTATVAHPIHDHTQSRPQRNLDIASVAVTRQYSHNATPYLETRVTSSGVQHNSLRPTLSLYLPTGISWASLPERVLAVVSSSRGGLELHGGTATERYWLRGPFFDGAQFDLEIAPPVGTRFFLQFTFHDQFLPEARTQTDGRGVLAPLLAARDDVGSLAARPPSSDAQTPIGTCVDGLDNDPDGYADDCDYACVVHKDFGGDTHDYQVQFEDSKDYALIGDFDFCDSHPTPEAYFEMISVVANGILNNLDPPTEYQPAPRSPPFRMTMTACPLWVGATQNEIEACHANASNCPAGVTYPLGGTGTSPDLKVAAAWEALEAAIASKAASQIRPVHMAVVVTDGGLTVNGQSGGVHFGSPDANGRLVIAADSTNPAGPAATLAHEIGHTLGLGHDYVQYDGVYVLGFMNQGGVAPVLAWEADSNIPGLSQGEIWRSVSSKRHPRASGFAWTGCDNDGECSTGHPGLVCNEEDNNPQPMCVPEP